MSSTQTDLVRAAYRERAALVSSFFTSEAERLADLCHAMATRFSRGGRLLALGAGPAATDAQHVSVEFVHPVIVGKRALPAIALPNEVGASSAFAAVDGARGTSLHLGAVVRAGDMVIGIAHSDTDEARIVDALSGLEERDVLPIALLSGAGESPGIAYTFRVPSSDPFVVQEIQETLYHVLWELVHVFFEHGGLLDDAPRARDIGRSSFLYPSLDRTEAPRARVLEEVARSIVAKASDVNQLRDTSEDGPALAGTASEIKSRIDAGGSMLIFGNGGSATDAQDLTVDLLAPPGDLPPIAALSLASDTGVITGVANDVGFENVFARQIIAHGSKNDVAVAISTSGGSRNVVAAVEEAKRRGMLTVCFAGYGGGALSELCDRAHVVGGQYVPRIQEAQATQYHCLRRLLANA